MVEKSMSTSPVLSVRVSPEEKQMLQVAAEQSRSSVSDFIRRKSLEAAENALMERRIITLSEDDWVSFEDRMAEAPKVIPLVKELFRRPSVCS